MALKAITLTKSLIDRQMLERRLQYIEATVHAIGWHLADDVMNDVRVGFGHLADAFSLAAGPVRDDELTLARGTFARLTSRPVPPVQVTGSAVTADDVHALGHLGNHYYFLLRGEPRRALVEAYTCTERFPELGVQMFPPEIFSKDYRWAAETVIQDARNSVAHELSRQRYRQEAPDYYREWGLKIAKSTGAVVGGLAGAAVNPALAGQGLMYAFGQLTTGTDGSKPYRPGKRMPNLARPEHRQMMEEAVADARQRRQSLG